MKIRNQIAQWMKIKHSDDDGLNDENVLEYKILILGEKMVGKSSICSRFSQNEFNLEIKPSTQTECYPKTVKLLDQYIRVYLIDVSSDTLKNPKSFIFSDVKGALIVYDITKTKTFDKIDDWVKMINTNVGKPIPFIIVGNKCDLKFLRNVDSEEANEKGTAFKCDVKETSCIDENSVQDCLKYLIAKIYYEELSEEKKEEYKNKFANDNNENVNNQQENENKIDNNNENNNEKNHDDNNEKK